MNPIPTYPELFSRPLFLKLWTSQLLSQLTVYLVNFLIITRIFEITESTIAVSLLWIAWSLPALIFGPFSGAVVDRFSRRQTMVVTNLLQAAVIGSYLVFKDQIFSLYIIVFMYSLLDQLYLPSQQSSIPAVAPGPLLSAANGIFLLTQQASLLVGFGLGGIFLSLLGRDTTIALASLSLIVAAISVYLLPRDSAKPKSVWTDLEAFWRDLAQGYLFVKSNRPVLFPLLVIIAAQIFITIVAVILPSFTRQILALDLNHSGLAVIVPGSLGALGATFLIPRLLQKFRKKILISTGLGLASLSLGMMSLLPRFPYLNRLVSAVFVAIALGSAIAVIIVPAQTLLQEKTPAGIRGRVYGSLGFLITLSTSLPLLVSATVADIFGTPVLIAVMAGMLFLGFILVRQKGDRLLWTGRLS